MMMTEMAPASPKSAARSSPALYWHELLASAPTKLELPTDRPRPAIQTLRQSTETLVFPSVLLEKLQALAKQEQATLHMTLGAVFFTLLQRYTGQDDILVAAPILRRTLCDRSLSVVNTVVVRAHLSDHLSFRSFLRQVREGTLGAYEHADTPFESLVAQFAPELDPSHAPLCQVMFSFAEPEEDASDLDTPTGEWSTESACYDLALLIAETENGWKGSLAYSTDLFEAQTMRRLCAHFGVMLEAIVRDPDQVASTLPMLTEPERKRILQDWNDTRVEYPATCAHRLYEQQAVLHPDATAIVYGDQRLSYRELNERANQVAHYLRKRGIGPDVLVGVCLERCPELVIALLGVWKAGGAYVPLDPTNPADRLQYMLTDSMAKVLLTSARQRHLFPGAEDNAICIDSDWPMLSQESTDNLDATVSPADLAYVMYTSGSTGKPKGGMILHGGLVNYLCWAAGEYAAGTGECVPVHSSIAFDLTVTALWAPLVAGGRVELLPEDVGGQNLLAAMRKQKGRTLVKITPAHLALLAEQLGPDQAADRTSLFVIGGENLSAESLQLWRDHAPDSRLINEYGPTETVVGCCVYEVRADDPRSGSIPIGRPIANTQLYVLDRLMNPVPWGVAGELYIGGAGVARGYWNRPELTKEKFLPDPFSKTGDCQGTDVPRSEETRDGGARLYKTGDIARYRPDGILEYLGRVDNQVKVRGYRIELGEIEAKLAEHPAVKASAVLAREDTPGNKQLVAYVVLHGHGDFTAGDLRSALRNELPEYMLPARFVFLEAMPLTSNGKVDRRALPAPSNERTTGADPHGAARTATEQSLVDIWRELLGVDQIGVDDNFFELGGHSLLAMKTVSRIREVFGVDLSPQAVIDDQTIAALARIIVELAGPAPVVAARTGSFFFGDPQLYAAYHGSQSSAMISTALLACPSIGHEHTRAHRAIKLLCEATARSGIAAMRFDYSGVGDSAGELSSQQLEVWSNDVLRATDELLARSGASSVFVVGCRLGGALAAAALRRAGRPIQSLCLWDPVLSGEEFLRVAGSFQERFLRDRGRFSERTILARLANAHSPTDDSCVGYPFSSALRRSLQDLDLRQVEAWPTVPIHAVLSEHSASWDDLAMRLAAAGRRVRSEVVEGAPGAWDNYAVHEKTLRAGPLISRIVDFLKEGHS